MNIGHARTKVYFSPPRNYFKRISGVGGVDENSEVSFETTLSCKNSIWGPKNDTKRLNYGRALRLRLRPDCVNLRWIMLYALSH